MSDIYAKTLTKHTYLSAGLGHGQFRLKSWTKASEQIHLFDLDEAKEFFTQCLAEVEAALPKPKKEKGSVQVKLVGTLPKDTPEPVDEFKRMLQETGIQAGDTILMDGKPHTITSIRPSQMPNRVHVTLGWATEVLPTWESLVEMKEAAQCQDWDTAVLRNCQHSWHIDDARDTPTCPGCDAEA